MIEKIMNHKKVYISKIKKALNNRSQDCEQDLLTDRSPIEMKILFLLGSFYTAVTARRYLHSSNVAPPRAACGEQGDATK